MAAKSNKQFIERRGELFMSNVKKIVIEAYKEVLKNNNLNITPDLNNVVERESGLDSLGMVDFVVAIEDSLNISLDPILANIRQSNTINDIVDLIEKLIDNKS